MSEEGQLLSDEERMALAEAVASGDMASDTGLNLRAEVRRHDLTAEDSSLGVNVSSIDMINERFIRLFRLGMLESLRTSTKVNPMSARIVRFGEYLDTVRPPLSVNTIRLNPLRGQSIVVIEPSLIFTALDNFFGGMGRGVADLPAGRLFTPTETRIANVILDIIFSSLKEAWSPLMAIEFEHVGSEINPQFAQIADEDDLVVWTRFESEGEEGGWDLVYPYASLKPLREMLRSRVQTGDGDEASDAQWRLQLKEAAEDAPLEVRVHIGEVEITVDHLKRLKTGETLWFERLDAARVIAQGIPCFDAELGERGGQVAISITQALDPGQ